jgi:hypothetical protein
VCAVTALAAACHLGPTEPAPGGWVPLEPGDVEVVTEVHGTSWDADPGTLSALAARCPRLDGARVTGGSESVMLVELRGAPFTHVVDGDVLLADGTRGTARCRAGDGGVLRCPVGREAVELRLVVQLDDRRTGTCVGEGWSVRTDILR